MGQQQLLLLVLATVIVGLATVAGIQAFDEGQTQARQDALTSRALTIGSDVYGALEQPAQLGGVDTDSDNTNIAAAAGYGNNGPTGIPADGAGDGATCDISSSPVKIVCTGGDGNQTVTVEVDGEGPAVTQINGKTVGT